MVYRSALSLHYRKASIHSRHRHLQAVQLSRTAKVNGAQHFEDEDDEDVICQFVGTGKWMHNLRHSRIHKLP